MPSPASQSRSSPLPCWLVAAVMAAPTAFAGSELQASTTGEALTRPATMVRQPERCVLLAAGRAGRRIVAVGERGVVAYSDDSGQQWRQATVPSSVTLTALRFADDRHGYAIGHGGTVLATSDAGQTWVRRLDGRQIANIELADAKGSGDIAAARAAERLAADGPDKPLLDLVVFDARRLLVVGAYGLALVSDDGGQTWKSWRSRIPNPKELHLYAVRRLADQLVIAGEQGLLLRSRDNGKNFTRVATPYPGSLFTVELPDEQTIVVAGLRGNVLRSIDSGSSWTTMPTPMPVSVTASALDPDGQVVVTNQAGFVLSLRNNQWVRMNDSPLPPLNGLLLLDRSSFLVASVQGLLAARAASGVSK